MPCGYACTEPCADIPVIYESVAQCIERTASLFVQWMRTGRAVLLESAKPLPSPSHRCSPSNQRELVSLLQMVNARLISKSDQGCVQLRKL